MSEPAKVPQPTSKQFEVYAWQLRKLAEWLRTDDVVDAIGPAIAKGTAFDVSRLSSQFASIADDLSEGGAL